MYYAIRNKRTKKFISGTDYRYNPPHQIAASEWRPPLIISAAHHTFLETTILHRRINMKRYEVVKINIIPEEEEKKK